MKHTVNKILYKLGYRVQSIKCTPRQLLEPSYLRPIELADVLKRRMFERGADLTFIQIGAFDGVTKDPLRSYISAYGWRGVLVEPQPEPASRLRELYRDNDRIIVLEAALDREPRTRTLFTVECKSAPMWAAGMASFQRSHIIKHHGLIPGLEDMIREITVDCVSFTEIFQLARFDRVDLLQIDAEGADADILSLFPFDRAQPAIIHWEVKNLTTKQREDCLEHLAGHGYRFAPSGQEDMLAIAF